MSDTNTPDITAPNEIKLDYEFPSIPPNVIYNINHLSKVRITSRIFKLCTTPPLSYKYSNLFDRLGECIADAYAECCPKAKHIDISIRDTQGLPPYQPRMIIRDNIPESSPYKVYHRDVMSKFLGRLGTETFDMLTDQLLELYGLDRVFEFDVKVELE